MKQPILYLLVILLLAGCVSKTRETELLNKITELEQELDDCQFGSDKILAKIKIEFENENFAEVKILFAEMEQRHPESEHYSESKSFYDKVINIEEQIRREAERKVEMEKQAKLKALKKLKKNYDDVSGITWYKQPYFIHYTNTNLTSIYLGDNGTSRWLRLMMTYQGDDWIFFEKAYLSYDGNTKEIVFDKYENKETENSGGGVWEWIDVKVTKDLETFLREFSKSKNAKMRFTGKYTKTRNLIWNERQGIRDVLNGYDALESDFN
jgi:hypothetical protein